MHPGPAAVDLDPEEAIVDRHSLDSNVGAGADLHGPMDRDVGDQPRAKLRRTHRQRGGSRRVVKVQGFVVVEAGAASDAGGADIDGYARRAADRLYRADRR